ncbi:hypothetical protein SOASR030_35470 [Leminorella grimontii]|uniref:Rhs family protein n=1 Tax=Leminorella grimontii TaxID=82981 RepID=A0AAV5N5N3_9GAMM|nr:hypothetical protein SOASR030_35470 [Leminorella grimontii]VFS54616.1 Uncharacterised protein [Leminorella grimontii]
MPLDRHPNPNDPITKSHLNRGVVNNPPRTFSREDYGQQKTHGQLGYDENNKVPPHEHKITYNDRGYVDKQYYRKMDKDGKAIGPWIEDKK